MSLTTILQSFVRKPVPRRFRHDGRAQGRVYLLADHLDAALAAGEDLLKQRLDVLALTAETDPDELAAWHGRLRGFMERVRNYELVLMTRVQQARKRAEEAKRSDGRLALFAKLFLSGTNVLSEVAEIAGDPRGQDFDGGSEAMAFLKKRALLAADCDGLETYSTIEVTDRAMVAGVVPLGVLLDQIAGFLDAIEVHYDLFAGDDELGEHEAAA